MAATASNHGWRTGSGAVLAMRCTRSAAAPALVTGGGVTVGTAAATSRWVFAPAELAAAKCRGAALGCAGCDATRPAERTTTAGRDARRRAAATRCARAGR